MTNALAFEEEIWDEDSQGIYEKYHNANTYAKERWSAQPDTELEHNSEPGKIWTFPDGTECWIGDKGKSCTCDFEKRGFV